MSEKSGSPGIGHNQASVTDLWKQENTTLAVRIAEDNAALKKLKDDLIAGAAGLPKTIKNDDQSGEVSDYVKKLRNLVKDAEKIRVATKAPILDAENIVDSIFKKFKAPLNELADELNARGTKYDLAVEEKRRAKLEAEAAEARAAEDAARRAAEKAARGKKVEAAVEAAVDLGEARTARVQAEAAADVKASEITKVVGESSKSALVDFWHATVEDFDIVDLNALRADIPRRIIEEAAERMAKALKSEGVGKVKGVKVWSEKQRRVS